MKLLTQQIRKKFEKYPLRSQQAAGDDAVIVAKFFDPTGRYTFYATEGSEKGEDFIVFGYCISPLGPDCDEMGYASINEMQQVTGRFGLGIERDIHFPVGETKLSEIKGR